jgi:hypothetical protein
MAIVGALAPEVYEIDAQEEQRFLMELVNKHEGRLTAEVFKGYRKLPTYESGAHCSRKGTQEAPGQELNAEGGFMFSAKQISSGQEILALLNCRRLPARLSTGETAVLLGFQEHAIAPLIAAKLLAPLGKPAPNAPKYFATVDVLAAAQDRDWLSQATRALARHWRIKNSRKRSAQIGDSFFDAAA